MKNVFRLDEFEALAKERMEPAAYDYYAGGAADEITLADNVAAFRRYRLRPRVLVDIAGLDTSTTMLGERVAMPVGITPTALQTLAHPEGEVATARAAADAGVVFGLSSISGRALEDVAAASAGPKWFQLYVHKDKGISKAMLERAVAAGFKAIVLTVDLPVPGYRERELRSGLQLPKGGFGNFAELATEGLKLLDLIEGVVNPSLTWDDLDWIRSIADLPLLIKGILTAEDTAMAMEHGVAGVVVSNHGGRQLDRAPASIDVLEEIVDAAAGRCEVYLDGGVRRGTDVLIALALGARGVFIGRPLLYALAAGGQEGVTHALKLIKLEVANAQALLGTPTVSDVTRAHVRAPSRTERESGQGGAGPGR
jgi:isopentenyl diphosphate isomerase/L-lactate dehydrogenase-like FMN-dependent dehydrogenase